MGLRLLVPSPSILPASQFLSPYRNENLRNWLCHPSHPFSTPAICRNIGMSWGIERNRNAVTPMTRVASTLTQNQVRLTLLPSAIRKIALLPEAWGEKNSTTSSS